MNRSIAEEIKRLRTAAGYSTLGDLYRASKVTVSTLSRIEAGIQKPTPATLKKLAPCLGVSYEHLLIVAGYLPQPGQVIVRERYGDQGVLDIDQLLDDYSREIRIGGRVISNEQRKVLKENLNLIRRLLDSSPGDNRP